MSNEAQSWAWKQNCGFSSDKNVLVALADNAWEDGSNAWPSVALLARKTGLVRRTVQMSLRRLELNGFIEKTAEADPGRTKPTTYRVVMDRDPAQPLRRVAQPRRGRNQDASADTAPPSATDSVDPAQLVHPPCAAVAPKPSMNQLPEPSKEIVAFRDDVEQVCGRLQERMIGNGCKPPTITKAWRDSARLLLDRDQRPLNEVLYVLDWSQNDTFWRKNIHSLPTFREKYDRLRMSAQEHSQRSPQSNIDGFRALIQKFEAERIGGAQ